MIGVCAMAKISFGKGEDDEGDGDGKVVGVHDVDVEDVDGKDED